MLSHSRRFFILVLTALVFDCFELHAQTLFILEDQKNTYGIIDGDGKTVLGFNYSHISEEYRGLVLTDSMGNKGFNSFDLDLILPLKYQKIFIHPASDLIVAKNDQYYGYGYYDFSGQLKLPHQYIDASVFKSDSALVLLNENDTVRYIWINKQGHKMHNAKISFHKSLAAGVAYQYCIDTRDGVRKKRKKWGVFIKENWILKPIYSSIVMTCNGFYIVNEGGLEGVFDINGNEVIAVKYLRVEPVSQTIPNKRFHE